MADPPLNDTGILMLCLNCRQKADELAWSGHMVCLGTCLHMGTDDRVASPPNLECLSH